MAEQPTDIPNQQTAGDGNKQEETVVALNDNQKHPESKQDKEARQKSESREVLEPACVETSPSSDMAEQPTDIPNQQTAGDGNKQEETVVALNDNQKHPESKQDKEASLSACTNSETKSESREVLEPTCVETSPASDMAEQPTDIPNQQTAGDGNKQEETVVALNDNQKHPESKQDKEASLSACTNSETKSESREVLEPTCVETSPSSDMAEQPTDIPNQQTAGDGNKQEETVVALNDNQKHPESKQDKEASLSACTNSETKSESREVLEPTCVERRDHLGEMATPETTSPQSDEGSHRGDDPKKVDIVDSKGTTNANTEAENDVETVGATSLKTASSGGNGRYLLMFGLMFLALALVMQKLLHPESPPQQTDEQQVDIFLRQMEKVMIQFPNQRPELWKRSRIHLLRHLQTAQPTEPVSLILTAGLRAEKTLHCLAQGLAFAFSAAFNASFLQIDGASKASQDSDLVKLDIDSNLQGAFEGDKPVAVIHRFEELPPGSTLIFYRYCDHENAAYKKTFLIFTVLLGEEEDIPAESRLNAVEEMVDDHLQKKFLSDSHPVSYDKMDLDKYGGLWSRISHLILPVAAEKKLERNGCGRT